MAKERATVVFETTHGHQAINLSGRNLWAFNQLFKADAKGCTPIDNPAPRWSAYVHNLREMGLRIESVTEQHGGPYSGNHARYVLASIILAVISE